MISTKMTSSKMTSVTKITITTVCLFIIGAGAWVANDIICNETIVKLPAQPPKVQVSEATTSNGTRNNTFDFYKGNSSNDALYALIHKQSFDFSTLAPTYEYINRRYDTSDFRLPSLIRILYQYQEQVPVDAYNDMKMTLLNYKYWMDQPGQDSMCYWSENHQILFSSAEYLVGQLWPNETFTNDGKSGTEHHQMARQRILDWLEQRWLYGFAEWYSNTYYVEDIAPLVNLVDFGDEEISTKAAIILDLLFHDVATQSYQGTFISSSGRMYEKGKRHGDRNSMRKVIAHIWGDRYNYGEEKGMLLNFIHSDKYQIPDVIKSIGYDESEQIIKASNGLNVSELAQEGLIGQEDKQIMMQWAMESFTNPETFSNTIEYVAKHKMFSNEFLHDLKIVNIGLLKFLNLLPSGSQLLNPVSNGIAIQRANTYTYKTKDYMIATAQAYHPGSFGDQQHLWNATIDNEVSIFTTHPAAPLSAKGALSLSPGYWVGNGTNPHVVQDKNVVLAFYKIPDEAGFMGKKPVHYTHAHFPSEAMDEAIIDGRYAFGRKGGKFVAFTGKNNLKYQQDSNSDLIQDGKDTYWIFEVSTQEQEQDFETFIARIKANTSTLSGNSLRYNSNEIQYELNYQQDFNINNRAIDLEYPRFDSSYSNTERKPKSITIEHDAKSLHLNFYQQTRLAQ